MPAGSYTPNFGNHWATKKNSPQNPVLLMRDGTFVSKSALIKTVSPGLAASGRITCSTVLSDGFASSGLMYCISGVRSVPFLSVREMMFIQPWSDLFFPGDLPDSLYRVEFLLLKAFMYI